ncbi:MAG: signal recognition particle-docking protein FtsY [Puniceicoccaceae bacterium]|nr:MAG: signal recognition particle-docking protein FtsY [Puniceicoccaceae bacterium]
MLSLFKRFKDGLTRSTRNLLDRTGRLFGLKKLDAASIEDLEEALHGADFGVETADAIITEIRTAYRKNPDMGGKQAAEIGAAVLRDLLRTAEASLAPAATSPTVVCLVGINGSGKTTTAAKLAHLLRAAGHRPLLAACDTFRAAAIDQLRTWAERLDFELVAGQHGADAAAVAFDAWQAARKRGHDFLLVDTAGRLHTKTNLMAELGKIRRVLAKNDPAAPHYSLLVVDASLGTNSVDQARVFHQQFGLDGIIVTKLDGTSRGGALVAIHRELGLPIHFVGLGEQAEDLQPFSADAFVAALFGLEREEIPA